ncbi:superfamily II DNA or RNA helicase [Rhizobium leguminosarum]|uniref:Superfamily II DNA or RNA helicase n=1 Tax=Rhizobium leguminosarum TaxID=384 RepID=A0A7Z0E450_RHILE|nr:MULTISPECIES: DEAD/DEAH box helicase [unclassified Rhizobium]MDK4716093.1 DEAD/DEAH box helicase [Rhizobium sp. CNPSo 4039]MDK4722073.1 DEAD/DEAH box helicase [Rhizobium sp. CNPSo 3968]NYJ14715.1 superfamily II DNA or RNA helicase [Rhizobium leguminosarum]
MEAVRFSPGDLVEARGREWVVLPSPDDDILNVRPLSGSEADAQRIALALEVNPVRPARFAPPTPERRDTQDGARLLADALRLSLRRGAGPFRSAAHLGVEPRAYQLVPLMMALKLPVVRLLIADDVGIGKTIEAALIVREMLDRGLIDRFSVLCPPHLVEQWVSELAEKFDIDAVAVTSARARSLERGLPAAQSLFEAYPHTVVSLDYIKADSRRDEFARACPSLVIVDEAHACIGGDRGRHQRFELLERLASDEERHMLLLTATPHSGDEAAFDRLLGLISPDFAGGPQGDENARTRYARRLAQHYVQRRRPDITEAGWHENRTFPVHQVKDEPFSLSGEFGAFHDRVLDYCLAVTQRAGADQRSRRLAFWGTLALMRCVGSSPAAAINALRNRLSGVADEEAMQPVVFDEDEGLLDQGDVEPGTASDSAEERGELTELVAIAESLDGRRREDPKVARLLKVLKGLLQEGAKPVVFCRFIATAEALGEEIKRAWPKADLAVVTGRLPPEERRTRIDQLEDSESRILVATDCLSEGINLQALFDAVVHYDLSWNPTRHQQREGRVDRFGQRSPVVRSVTIFGDNSAIDGAVLQVILRKADAIRKATGISVPMPEDSEGVTSALMQALMLRAGGHREQLAFDFGLSSERLDSKWRDAEENAKASRARYAQGALKPDEVLPEWRQMRALNGGPTEVARFTERALKRVGAPLEKAGQHHLVHFHAMPDAIKERLEARGFRGTRRVGFEDDPAPGVTHLGRVHPLVASLAESLAEGALDPEGAAFRPLGRCGVWRTRKVAQMTTLLMLRNRFKLITSGRLNRMLLAEEATGLAFGGLSPVSLLKGPAALDLLEAEASGNLDDQAVGRQLQRARERLANYESAIAAFAAERGAALSDDHLRLTEAARGGATVEVVPALPADIIGLYVLLPEDE